MTDLNTCWHPYACFFRPTRPLALLGKEKPPPYISLQAGSRGRPVIKNIFSITLLFSFLTLLSACAVNPVTGKKELMLVSESYELRVANEIYPSAIWASLGGGGEYRDEKLKNYLNGIVLDIHRASHRPELPIGFAIQNSSIPNAWAIPGHVVITRGLLTGLGSESEFAFIMGHEMGHVSARHTARQMTQKILQSAGLAVAGVALSEKEYGQTAVTLGAVGSTLLLLKFSRADELEADLLGVQYMTALGYDRKNAVKAHISLERSVDEYLKSVGRRSRETTIVEELLSTHPRSSMRIKEIEGLQGSLFSKTIKGDGTGSERFQEKISGLKKTDAIYRKYYDKAISAFSKNEIGEADALVTTAILADGTQPPFHVLKGYIGVEKKDYSGAEKHFARALRLDNGYQPAHRGMGTLLYLRKDYTGAISRLRKALDIYPQDLSSRFFLGMSHFRTTSYRSAIEELKAYTSAQPKDPQAHYYLGSSYESTGDILKAYEEYMIQVKTSPDNTEGRLASERLKALKRSKEEAERGRGGQVLTPQTGGSH